VLREFWEFIVRDSSKKSNGTLYLHYPCFDGLVSGVLASDFLENHQQWVIRDVCPVNYDLRNNWLTTSLSSPSAIVDFLYHPQAAFWADHHLTSFINEKVKNDFEHRKAEFPLMYDNHLGSSALLLWNYLGSTLSYPERYKEMVDWAERIDSAGYSSVDEAVVGNAPAIRINFSLMAKEANTKDYCLYLLGQLRQRTLREVADLSEVRTKYEHVQRLIGRGLDHLREHVTPLGNIVAFDVEANENMLISRYAPYYFFPKASYSIGITRYSHGAKITAMRNPWRNFESVPLGTIFARYGGGGHQRVASVFLPADNAKDVEGIADQLLSDIRRYEAEYPATTTEAVLA
jgi:hypothetical protein